jgi:predicted nucleotidyltransferase component of viral defense system
MNATYIEAVRLLLEAIPVLFKESRFAMKGGTAINLFVQDLPRLSVDIDVVLTDHTASREAALRQIGAALEVARNELNRRGIQAESPVRAQGDESKLFLRRGRQQVKVEVNHVFRGTLMPVRTVALTPESRRLFTTEVEAPVLATAELYGGKLVAALDRQHPRDLFDVHCLFEGGGLTDEMVECFVAYLAGHNRPVHEVLFSRDQELAMTFENEFQGMARIPVELAALVEARQRLRQELRSRLTDNHRQFLLGLVRGEPPWEAMRCRHLSELPAIRWKLQNLAKLKRSAPDKFERQALDLTEGFGR